jgi:hypothetical protein
MVLLQKKIRVREYQMYFLTFGLTYQLVNGEELPWFLMCGKVFANNSFNARNLCRNLTTKHESLENKPLQFFERKKLDIRKQSDLMRTAATLKPSTYSLL